jgi:hypothetical protein
MKTIIKTIYVHQIENPEGKTATFSVTTESGEWVDREIAKAIEYGFSKYNGVIKSYEAVMKQLVA